MRLTLDWDNIDEKEFKSRIDNLRVIFPDNKIIARISANGNHHVVIYDTKFEFPLAIKFRRIYGDDPKRIACDEENHKRGIPSNVLFSQKDGKKAKNIEI